MSPSQRSKLIWTCAVVALAVVVAASFIALAVRQRSRPAGAAPAELETFKPDWTVAPDPPAPPSSPVENVRHEPTAVRFDLTLKSDSRGFHLDHPLIFAVPGGRQPRARLESCRLPSDDAPTSETAALLAAMPADPIAMKAVIVRPMGVMRRWNLCALDLAADFFRPLTSLPSGVPAALTASFALEWDAPHEPPTAASAPDPAWDAAARIIVSNTEGLALWPVASPNLRADVSTEPTAPWRVVPGERSWFRMSLLEEGLHEISMDSLILAGVPSAQARPDAFRLFRLGEPVKLLRVGAGADARVYFWHTAGDSHFTATKTYFATLDSSLPDPRIEAVPPSVLPGEPAPFLHPVRTAYLDRDNKIMIESGNFLAIKRMEWIDAPVTRAAPLALPLTLNAYAPTTSTLSAAFKFHFEPPNQLPSHRLHLKKHSTVLGTLVLHSTEDLAQTLPIPASSLTDGLNEFSLELDNPPGTRDDDRRTTVWLDHVRMPYTSLAQLDDSGRLTLADDGSTTGIRTRWTPLVSRGGFDRAAALAIGPDGNVIGSVPVEERDGVAGLRWPSGRGYRVEVARLDTARKTASFDPVVKDDLADAGDGCDMLVIAHREFMEEAGRLAVFHRNDGMRVRVADVESVYDNFSSGDPTPHAIRNMLGRMLAHWGALAPARILLFGDCTSDYLNVTRTDVRNFVPSFSFDADLEDWASDYWLAAVTDDHLQDFMIGRISVSNPADARAVVDKIIKYSTRPQPGAWRARAAFVADDGGFVEPIEELRRDHTPAGCFQERIYLDGNAPLEDNMYLPSRVVREKRMKVSPILTARIREAFNRGVAYVNFYGHGSPNIWMEERIWFGGDSANSDNQFLANSGHAAFVTTMTCNTGAIDYPVPKGLPGGGWNLCISEDMMRQPDGGAVALYVPSGPSVTGIQHQMSIELHRTLFGDNVRALGELQAVTTTRYLARAPEFELAYMLIMLGDPAMKLQLAGRARTFAPRRRAWAPGTTMNFALDTGDLRAGRFAAELRAIDGAVLAQTAEQAFDSARVPIRMEIPADCGDTTATLSVYAWESGADRDLLASAALRIEEPRLDLAGARWNNQGGITALVKNQSAVEGRAAVTLHIPPDAPDPAAETTVYVAPLEEKELAFALHSAIRPEADCAEVRLNGTRATARRLIIPLPGKPPAIVADASRRRAAADGGAMELVVRARSDSPPGAPPEFVVTDLAGAVIAREPAVSLPGGGVEALFTIPPADSARATSGTLLLAPAADASPTSASALCLAPVASIPLDLPRLAIVPGSIRFVPERPFDGQTIWVDFEVENRGRAPVAFFSVGLYDGPPAAGGMLIPDHFRGTAQISEGPLAPGARRRLSLRADPVDNAGGKTWVLSLNPQTSRGESTPEDLIAPVVLNVRRKADLQRGATNMAEVAGPDGGKSFTLKGEVANVGETDAHSIMVVFFGSAVRSPENILGRVLLPVVRAGEKVEAALQLDEAMLKKLKDLGDAAKPNHQLVLNWRRSFSPEEDVRRR